MREMEEEKVGLLQALKSLVGQHEGKVSKPSPPKEPALPKAAASITPAAAPSPARPIKTSESVTGSEQKILDALASLEAVGVSNPSKTQLAAFAGYSNPKSGGFAAPFAALVRKGLAKSSVGKAGLTDAGRAASSAPSRPATSKELQERIFHLLGEGERKMLTL